VVSRGFDGGEKRGRHTNAGGWRGALSSSTQIQLPHLDLILLPSPLPMAGLVLDTALLALAVRRSLVQGLQLGPPLVQRGALVLGGHVELVGQEAGAGGAEMGLQVVGHAAEGAGGGAAGVG
jgi:hypothetical protein